MTVRQYTTVYDSTATVGSTVRQLLSTGTTCVYCQVHVDSVDSIDSCDRQGVSWIRKITLNTSGTWVFEVWIHQEPEYSRSEYIRNLRIQKYSWILEYVLIFSSRGSAPQLTLCVINIKYITRFWNNYVHQPVLYFLLYFLLYFVLFWWSPANWLKGSYLHVTDSLTSNWGTCTRLNSQGNVFVQKAAIDSK